MRGGFRGDGTVHAATALSCLALATMIPKVFDPHFFFGEPLNAANVTVRGTQTVSFAPLAFKLFYAARQNAVLRRSPFPPP